MKKLSKMLVIMFMVLGVFFVSNTTGNAAGENGTLVDVIDNIEITKANNNGEGLRKYDKIQIKIDWSGKGELHSGDYFYIDLPSQLYNVNSTFPIKVKDDNAEVEAGTCVVENNRLKCVFNDYVTNRKNIKGNIFIERLFVGNISKEETEVPFEFSFNGNTVHVEKIEADITNSDVTNKTFAKYGYYDEDGILVWNLKVNLNNQEVDNLVVEDYLGSNQVIDKDSIRIFTCQWNEDGELIYESLGENLIKNFKTEVKDNYFKIYIGKTNKNYFITYNVKIIGVQDEYTNKAIMEGSNINKHEVEVNIEALKNYASAVGGNDSDVTEDEKEDVDKKEEDSIITDKDENKKEDTIIDKKDEVKEDVKLVKDEKNISKTGDKAILYLISILLISIVGIVLLKKKNGGLQK